MKKLITPGDNRLFWDEMQEAFDSSDLKSRAEKNCQFCSGKGKIRIDRTIFIEKCKCVGVAGG